MSLFSSTAEEDDYGVVIDIGSASVGISIVLSHNLEESILVIWSYREYGLIKDTAHEKESLKDINTALVNALLELGNSGLKALYEHSHKIAINYVQVAICAPWSYTVTKTIHYEDEHPFKVDDELIAELVATARKETQNTEVEGELIQTLGLRTITDTTTNVQLNGYSIKDPIGQEGRSIQLAHITAVAQEKILMTLEDSLEKVLPKAKVEYFSFMYLFYRTLKNLHPDTSEICLIDVTNEATEIGIVRDNVLRYATHTPFGMYSLAREIAFACNIPKEEAFSYLKSGRDWSDGSFTQAMLAEIDIILNAYEDKIAELFKHTGDTLAIPKTLFLHTAKATEEFFSEHIKNAAKKATTTNHSIHLFTSEVLEGIDIDDTALGVSVYTFHTRERYENT
jgi:cell division ATPase FtsA